MPNPLPSPFLPIRRLLSGFLRNFNSSGAVPKPPPSLSLLTSSRVSPLSTAHRAPVVLRGPSRPPSHDPTLGEWLPTTRTLQGFPHQAGCCRGRSLMRSQSLALRASGTNLVIRTSTSLIISLQIRYPSPTPSASSSCSSLTFVRTLSPRVMPLPASLSGLAWCVSLV